MDLMPYQWQLQTWQRLRSLNSKGRLPHALLFTGGSGIGKQHFAECFARYMLCSSPSEHACGNCKSCLLLQQGSHPDLMTVVPDEPGKPIKIDQIRRLSQKLSGSAQQGGYRVVVLNPAEEMNINAANALLKSLEEPGDRTLFLLVSHNPGRLMATVRSRCQSYPLALPEQQQAMEWLQQQQVDNPELLLRLSAGAPLRALGLHQQNGIDKRQLLLKGLSATASGRSSVVDVAVVWQKESPIQMLDWLQSLINDMIRYRSVESVDNLTNSDAESLILKASARIPGEKLFAFADRIQEYRLQVIAKTNPNRQLMFEDLLIYWLGLLFQRC